MTMTFENITLDSIIADRMGLSDAEKQYLLGLGEELAIAYKLLNARNETLALIPECPLHGPQCQPHMREWIGRVSRIDAAVGVDMGCASPAEVWRGLATALQRLSFFGWPDTMRAIANELEHLTLIGNHDNHPGH